MRTLIDLLIERAGTNANEPLYACLEGDEGAARHLTYEEVSREVSRLGEYLKSQRLKGERVLLFYPSGPDYIIAFLACLYAGIIAVPLYPPRKNQSVKRVLSVIADAAPAAILTTDKIFRYAPALFEKEGIAGTRWIITDTLEAAAHRWRPVKATGNDIAFLQYTSGSVGQPKGVMVTHTNLLENQQMLFRMFGRRQSPVMVSWLPIFHDMGLILFLLQPIYAAGSLYLLSPADFLQKPYRWLKTISDHQACFSGAPNFAYELCIRRITEEQRATLDLSSWKVALNAAEPVNAHTLERFYHSFKDCGFSKQAFYPCYGLAEATLGVSGEKREQAYHLYQADGQLLQQHQLQPATNKEEETPLVSCGMPVEQEVVIANPVTQEALTEEAIGEIWIRGVNVAKGYWNQPALTKETFEAVLQGRPGQHFLRTGDLGFMKDGELYITGRLKELIIIRGRNIYPQDVERIAETAHEALQPFAGAAFAVTADGTEQLVLVQELKRAYSREPDTLAIAKAIRQVVTEQLDVPLHAIWLIRNSSIPKTSSGKIQRLACKKAFLEGDEATLLVAGKWMANIDEKPVTTTGEHSLTTITTWLKQAIAEYCSIPVAAIQEQDTFDHLGLDSMAAAQVAGALSEWTGKEVPPTVVYDYPDIPSLANWLYQTLQHKTPQSRQATVAAPLQEADTPIAVVGIGCRFPDAPNPAAFWELIHHGSNAIHTVPAGRWQQLPETAYKGYEFIRSGGFIDNIDLFDAEFFGIAAKEAAKMDPQQRFLMEVSWQALEDAGIPPASLAGKQVGVFTGISTNDYVRLQQDPAMLDAWYGTGTAASIAANRLSYFYDFRGPSLAIDTACSSSLVAVHHACKSLQQAECNIALAAGVNIMAAPDLSLVFAKAGMLSPDGRCHTFDAAANGYVRGEGCGVVVLKRLPDAIKDGDRIYGVIKGSAINQDGRTNGLTAPNGPAQEAVIRAALDAAKVQPHQVTLVETHGTGTALGDPIEMNALQQVLSVGREAEKPCYVGAVKANIGHLEAAAGIAGLIKALLCLHHKQVAPQMPIRELNPHIHLQSAPLVIPNTPVSLADQKEPLIAGISAFGFGGANAHVIVEGYNTPSSISEAMEDAPHLVVLSAANESVLPVMAQQLAATLSDTTTSLSDTATSLNDIAANLAHGRQHLTYRMACVAYNKQELLAQLQEPVISTTPGHPKLAMLFTGQGAQYKMMAHGLYQREPVFRETLDACSQYLQSLTGVSLTDLLYTQQDDEQIHQTAITQPALFSIEVSLARLWASWGIVPSAVMGHSVGEIAAACIAGVFSMEDGIKLIAARGALMQALPAGGQMWALMATPEQVQPVLKGYERYISIAGINAPNQVVIAGDGTKLQGVIAALQQQKIICNPLKVSHAFHSPLMEPMIDAFKERIQNIRFHQPQIPLLSNVSGTWAGAEIATPDYWAGHILAPVLFSKSVQTLHQQGYHMFLEAGPHPVLNNLARQTLGTRNDVILLPSILNKSADNSKDIRQSLGVLHTNGFNLNIERLFPKDSFQKISLPLYPFKQERYWLSPEEMRPAVTGHPIKTGLQVQDLLYQQQWEQSAIVNSPATAPSVILAIADDINMLTALLSNSRVQHGQLTLLLPETLKDVLPGINRVHKVIYHSGDTPELYRTTLQDILQQRPAALDILLAFNMQGADYIPSETSVKMQYPYYNRVLHILQAISSLGAVAGEDVCRLLLFTPACSPVAGAPVNPPAAVLAAMMRSARLEMPELKVKTIEITTNSLEDWDTVLQTELSAASFVETTVAYYQGTRYVARLKPGAITNLSTGSELFDPAAVWLITGGTSSMTPALLEWMRQKGARHFLLVSRNSPQPAYQQQLQDLVTKINGSVTWCQADVAAASAVQVLQTQIAATGKTLGGIFHLAGILKDGPLHRLSWQDMEPVLAPKVAGTLHLHQLSLQYKPAYFVCFSSITAIFGGFYQSGYAAANAFMDAFAAWRVQQGLPALSINWGPWEGAGMAQQAFSHKMSGEEIVHKTNAAQNLTALELACSNHLTQATVMHLNNEAAARWWAGMPFLQQVVATRSTARIATHTTTGIGRDLVNHSKEEQYRQLSGLVIQELQQLMGVRKTIDPNGAFAAMGMDSMMTIVLQQRLQQLLELQFSAAAIYNYNTVRTLTHFLLEKLRALYKKPLQRTDGRTPSILHAAADGRRIDIDSLDEAAATALLEEVLMKYAL